MDVGIIGSGYVGKAICKYFAGKEYDVIFYDIDPTVVKKLQSMGFSATSQVSEATKAKYIFISVPTPTDENGEQQLRYIVSATRDVARSIDNKENHIIVIKSTILPGTTENILLPEIYKYANLESVGVIYSPEFLTEIQGTWTRSDEYRISPENEHRLVIGEGDNKYWGDLLLAELYRGITIPVIRTDYRTAEMIKYASNNSLAARISYWNEVFLICKELGIDSNVIAKAASLDPRIGVYGTVHGKAFGGKCLPKDLKAFVNFAKKYGDVPLHEAILKVNEYMKRKYGVRE